MIYCSGFACDSSHLDFHCEVRPGNIGTPAINTYGIAFGINPVQAVRREPNILSSGIMEPGQENNKE